MNCKNYKIFSLLFLISASSVFAQTKEETDKIMRSQDPKEISAFVKKYPNNPNANFLSNRLKNLAPAQSTKAKPVIQPLNSEKLSKEVEKKWKKAKLMLIPKKQLIFSIIFLVQIEINLKFL